MFGWVPPPTTTVASPWPGEEHLIERYTPLHLAIHEVLADWFRALEDGSYINRVPDPQGWMDWSENTLDELVRVDIDDYVWQQRTYVKDERGITADAGPGFERLPWPQRVALAQQLDAVIQADRAPAPESGPGYTGRA